MVAPVDLGYRPRQWQANVHRSLKRFSVLVVHRRAGKTILALLTLIDAALRTKKANARYAYVGPLLKQAKAVAWDYLKRYALKVPGTTANESELWVQFPNGARIRVFGADNPDGLRGIYLDGVVLDEVAQMKPEVWGEILLPTLTDRRGWALFIGTPKGVNLFSEIYFKALDNQAEWFAGLFTCYETEALPPEEIQRLKQEMSENQFRQEMLCDFSAAAENQLISLEAVNAAAARQIREDAYRHAPKILGVDVARYGGDRSVIFPRQGLAAFDPLVFNGIDNVGLADQVARKCNDWDPDAVFVDAGRGEGVIDQLLRRGFSPIPVDFGGRPSIPRYNNKRTEMWATLAEAVKNGLGIPRLQELIADLCGPTYTFDNARDVMVLESKDDMRARGLRSPDLGDGLALTYASPVAARDRGYDEPVNQHGGGRVIFDYDPFNRED